MFRCFSFQDAGTTVIYTLSLHDALPISFTGSRFIAGGDAATVITSLDGLVWQGAAPPPFDVTRSEEHTSELQSRLHLVCRLLLEKKNKSLSLYRNSHQRPFISADYQPSL